MGIMFFGTPHSGADPRGILQHIAAKAIKALGFSVNEQIINTLLPSAERLRELRDEFGLMAQEQNWMIYSFQEQFGITALNGNKVSALISFITLLIGFAGRRRYIILSESPSY
jgi:hypothetical protein